MVAKLKLKLKPKAFFHSLLRPFMFEILATSFGFSTHTFQAVQNLDRISRIHPIFAGKEREALGGQGKFPKTPQHVSGKTRIETQVLRAPISNKENYSARLGFLRPIHSALQNPQAVFQFLRL